MQWQVEVLALSFLLHELLLVLFGLVVACRASERGVRLKVSLSGWFAIVQGSFSLLVLAKLAHANE